MTADREAMLKAIEEAYIVNRSSLIDPPGRLSAEIALAAIEPLIAEREEAARREEREACIETIWNLPTLWTAQRNVIKRCADAIRARGES